MELILHPMVLPVVFPLLAGSICLLMPRNAQRTRAALAVVCAALTVALK